MFFIAYIFKGQVCVCKASENCKSLILQDKCNIEIFLSPEYIFLKPAKNFLIFSFCRSKVGGSHTDSVLVSQLQTGLTLEFEHSDPARRIRLLLSELLFILSQVYTA